MKVFFAFLWLLMLFAFSLCAMAAAGSDSLGIMGNFIYDKLVKISVSPEVVVSIIGILAMMAYRGIQYALQALPTQWRWVNNKLTLGIVNRILSIVFGKTTMLYNAQVKWTGDAMSNQEAVATLKKKAMEHLGRRGGILQAFNEATKQMK
jgi:hypothetical protein